LQPPATNTYAVANTVTPIITDGRLTDPISGIIGSLVTIRGTGLLGTQNVFFPSSLGGTVAATDLTIVSDREINFRIPGSAIDGLITVDTPGVPDTGTPFSNPPSTAPLPIQTTSVAFKVLPSPAPVIQGFFPASGPVGTFMTVSGLNFTGAVQVKVGSGIVDDYTIESDNIIKFRVPQLASTGPISIQTPGGTAFSPTNFTLAASPAPTLDYSSPRAPRGSQVTIAGTGLASTSKVLFNDVEATFTVISDTLITAVVPLTAGPGEIRVFTAGGNVASPTPFALTSVAPPVLSTVGLKQRDETQDAAPVGSTIEINTAATTVFEVDFAPIYSNAGTPASFTFGGGGIIVTVPELAPGRYQVNVYASTNSGDGNYSTNNPPFPSGTYWDTSYSKWTNILGNTFEYGELFDVLPAARPVIKSIAPTDSATFERGAPIAITGSGFTGANRIRFVTNQATDTGFDIQNIVPTAPQHDSVLHGRE